jgi:hypothetical protein
MEFQKISGKLQFFSSGTRNQRLCRSESSFRKIAQVVVVVLDSRTKKRWHADCKVVGMNLSLKLISAIGHATTPLLNIEINGAVGLVSAVVQHFSTRFVPRSDRRNPPLDHS